MSIETRDSFESLYHYNSVIDAPAIIESFWQKEQTPHPNFVLNFLGTRVSSKIHPPILNGLLGKVEGVPNPGNWHADIAEWGAALHSVKQAQERYRIIEVGCGWGCWLSNMGVAARSIGLAVDLIGVEGDAQHLTHARETLMSNGFQENDFNLFHGVAAPQAGLALFPSSIEGETVWGNEAIFNPSAEALESAKADPHMQILDCFPLSALCNEQNVDLLHIDIQGAEVDFVKGNFKDILTHVKRVLIGTHSRKIEGELMSFFLDQGWSLEMERPALTPIINGAPVTTIDGVQMWLNPETINNQNV